MALISLAVVLNVAALSDIINRGLPLRAMNELSFRWNSCASWLLVSSRWIAQDAAHMKINT